MSQILTQGFYKRLLSAIVLAPVCLWALISGGVPFYILIGIILGLSLSEWASLCARLKGLQRYITGFGGAAYILVCIYCFVSLPLYFNILLLIGIWLSDVGAYIIGKKFGRLKVVPTISPNKTLAGFLGACGVPATILLLVTLAFQGILSFEYQSICKFQAYQIGHENFAQLNPFAYLSALQIFMIFFFVGLAGQAGDLMISAIKRKVDVKDTGKLIPGHGGILDRIDAILLASPAFLGIIFLIQSLSC